jgi:aminopeptidase
VLVGDLRVDRMADLLVTFGANVQPGQMVVVGSDFGKEALTRSVARRCYDVGAVFVDVQYGDRHMTRARILYGSEEALGYEPAWTLARPRELAETRGAISCSQARPRRTSWPVWIPSG